MSLVYLIDGYNLLNHKGFSRYLAGGCKDKRVALVNAIKAHELTGSTNNKVILVFDGYAQADDAVFNYNKAHFQIIFSKNRSADEKIKDILEQQPNPKTWVVVSDDKEIIYFAKLKRAKVNAVSDFLKVGLPRVKYSLDADAIEPKISYTQADKINRELKKLWLD